MAAEAGNGDRVYLKVSDAIRLYLPHSDTCVSWEVASEPVYVAIIEEVMAELLHDNGSVFPRPIPVGEAGIYIDSAGRYYVPTRAVVSPQAGLNHPPLPPSLG